MPARPRGGRRVTFDVNRLSWTDPGENVLAVHDPVDRLAAVEPRVAILVSLRCFGGRTLSEAAGDLGIAPEPRTRGGPTRGPGWRPACRAVTYDAAGRLHEAIALLERVREAEIAKFGPDNVSTPTLVNFGMMYSKAGKLTEAIALLERARDTAIAKYGPDNVITLEVLISLATMYMHAGKLPEAIALLERVRDAAVATIDPDHPDTLTTL